MVTINDIDYIGPHRKISKNELTALVKAMKTGEYIYFDSINSHGGVYLSYGIQRLKWLNSDIILIGGFSLTVNIQNIINGNMDVEAFIDDFFRDNSIGEEVFLELGGN